MRTFVIIDVDDHTNTVLSVQRKRTPRDAVDAMLAETGRRNGLFSVWELPDWWPSVSPGDRARRICFYRTEDGLRLPHWTIDTERHPRRSVSTTPAL